MGVKKHYIVAIDQSTQGTKCLLFDAAGHMVRRMDRPHRQIINDLGWVEHDPMEIYHNLYGIVKDLLSACGIAGHDLAAVGISNQRETPETQWALGHEPWARAHAFLDA